MNERIKSLTTYIITLLFDYIIYILDFLL